MKKKTHMNWSWIFMILFLTLSIYDFKFGILGFICMGAPILHALKGQGKVHCQKYCPRGSLLGKFLENISLKNNHPKFITTKQFKTSLLLLMMTVFTLSMLHTGGNFSKIAFAMFRFMSVSMLLGLIMGIIYRPRTWCIICPMGHAAGLIKKSQDKLVAKRNTLPASSPQPVQITLPKQAA